MKLSELIEELEGMDGDLEVRIAHQPNWPFEYSIGNIVEVDNSICGECGYDFSEHSYEDDTECGEEQEESLSENVVYIGEGSQLGYLPGSAASALEWR